MRASPDPTGSGGVPNRVDDGRSVGLGTASAQLAKVIAELLVLALRGSDFEPDDMRRRDS
jgi:hypothetical protein